MASQVCGKILRFLSPVGELLGQASWSVVFALWLCAICDAQVQTPSENSSGALSSQKEFSAELLRGCLLEQCDEHGLPAMWAGLWLGQAPPIQAVVGVRKLGTDAGAEANDLLHIGSCTKAMTAVLVAELVTEGAISWNSGLTEIFGAKLVPKDSTWSSVTVLELLRHRSGSPANARWWTLDRQHSDVVRARRGVLEWLLTQVRPTERSYLYSNVGYALLGHIVEQKRGHSWEEIIQERLFRPLGIRSAGFGPVVGQEPLAQPWGHHAQGDASGLVKRLFLSSNDTVLTPVQSDNSRSLGPAGRVHMRLDDWARFTSLFHSGAHAVRDKLPIADSEWDMLQETGEVGSYAGGWSVVERSWAGGTALSHSGSNTMWHAVAWVAPAKDASLLVVINARTENTAQALDDVAGFMIRNHSRLRATAK